MGTDAHRGPAHPDEYVRLGQLPFDLGAPLRRQGDAEYVRSSPLCRRRLKAAPPRLSFDPARRHRQAGGDVVDAPFEKLAERGDRHRREHEVRSLADVEAPCTLAVLVAEVGQAREVLGTGAIDPVLLERRPLTVIFADEHVSEIVGDLEQVALVWKT
jgi:hypothetical protein